jgi:OTU domain-containing protein 6
MDEETMLARHRKEIKELTAKTTAMKKQATQGEKKKKKEILKQIETMESELKENRERELKVGI